MPTYENNNNIGITLSFISFVALCRVASSLSLMIKKQTIKACTFSWIKLPNIPMAQEKGVSTPLPFAHAAFLLGSARLGFLHGLFWCFLRRKPAMPLSYLGMV